MKCSRCSFESPPGSGFCAKCGKPLRAFGGPELPSDRTAALRTRENPVIAICKSPLFLVGIILFCISTMLIATNGFYQAPTSCTLIPLCCDLVGAESEALTTLAQGVYISEAFYFRFLNETVLGFFSDQETMHLFSMVPHFLLILGLWLTFGTAAKNSSLPSTAGLTVTMIASILYAVCLTLLWGGALYNLIGVSDSVRPSEETLYAVSIISTVAILAYYLALHISLCVVCVKLNQGFSKCLAPVRVSAFPAFLLVSSGFLTILNAGWYASEYPYLTPEYYLADMLQGAAFVLFGICLYAYNKSLK